MPSAHEMLDRIATFVPTLSVIAFFGLVLWLAHRLLLRGRADLGSKDRTPRQLVLMLLTIVALVAVIFTLPMDMGTRSHLLSLLGVALTAVIALSSTTFVSNAMAGLMLRFIRGFRPGDFIHVGNHFGRVTERGLLHTEIQTEDRDLTTLPNLYLVTNPLTTVRSSGTIVSANLSLGYDAPHAVVTPLLMQAGENAGLQEPFVHVVELGDFSVTYRVAGFLADTKHLLSARSNLRKETLDALHGAGVEIVSPTYMNQRVLTPDSPVLPKPTAKTAAPVAETAAESLIFDKADAAEKLDHMWVRRSALLAKAKEMDALAAAAEHDDKPALQERAATLRNHAETLEAAIARAEETNQENK